MKQSDKSSSQTFPASKEQALLLTIVGHQLHQNSQNYGQPILPSNDTEITRLDVSLLSRPMLLWQPGDVHKGVLRQMTNVRAHGNGVVDVLRDHQRALNTADKLTWPQMGTSQVGHHRLLSCSTSVPEHSKCQNRSIN